MVFIARRVVGKMCRNPPPDGCACHVVAMCTCTRHDTGMRCLRCLPRLHAWKFW